MKRKKKEMNKEISKKIQRVMLFMKNVEVYPILILLKEQLKF